MKTLDDAWRWYRDTRDLLRLVDRLATKHWDHLDWDPGSPSAAGGPPLPGEGPAPGGPEDAGRGDPAAGAPRPYKGLARDETIRPYTAEALAERAGSGLAPLDDLAVLVLFSAFESIVRDRVASEVEQEGEAVRHPALRHAVEATLDQIRDGSFFRVLEPYKSAHADLIEEVNQIRRYRNWVAHGRTAERPPLVTPTQAHERLTRFLDRFADRPIFSDHPPATA